MKKLLKPLLRLTGRLFPWVYRPFYFIERMIYGFSSEDCFDVAYTLDELIPKMLRELKEKKQGVPNKYILEAQKMRFGKMPEEYVDPTDEDIRVGGDMFNFNLDEMIRGFEAHRDMRGWKVPYMSYEFKELNERWLRGIALFIEDYDCLWW